MKKVYIKAEMNVDGKGLIVQIPCEVIEEYSKSVVVMYEINNSKQYRELSKSQYSENPITSGTVMKFKSIEKFNCK